MQESVFDFMAALWQDSCRFVAVSCRALLRGVEPASIGRTLAVQEDRGVGGFTPQGTSSGRYTYRETT